jgi:hypothetical protein
LAFQIVDLFRLFSELLRSLFEFLTEPLILAAQALKLSRVRRG